MLNENLSPISLIKWDAKLDSFLSHSLILHDVDVLNE